MILYVAILKVLEDRPPLFLLVSFLFFFLIGIDLRDGLRGQFGGL